MRETCGWHVSLWNPISPVAFNRHHFGNPLGIAGKLASEGHVLYWALVFFIVAIVAGVLGFGGVSTAAAGIAQILFFLFLVVCLVTLLFGLMGRRSPPPL